MKKLLASGIILLSLGAANAFASQTFSCAEPIFTAQTGMASNFAITCTNVSGRTFLNVTDPSFNFLTPNQFSGTPVDIVIGATTCTNFPDPNMAPGDSCTTNFTFTPPQIDTYVYEFIATAGLGGQQYGVFCNNNPSGDCFSIASRPGFVVTGDVNTQTVSFFTFNPALSGPIGPSPLRHINGPGAPSDINGPYNIFYDVLTDNIWVSSFSASSVAQFAFSGPNGNVAPITPKITGIAGPTGIGTDADGNIYVADYDNNAIYVYPPNSSGAAIPDRTISGPATQLFDPNAIFIMPDGQIFVANNNPGGVNPYVLVFDAGADGDVAPRIIVVPGVTPVPEGLWVDANGHIWVASTDIFSGIHTSIFEFAADAEGNATPLRTINGSNTNLSVSNGLAVDAAGYIYVTTFSGGSVGAGVNVYAPDAVGNAMPWQIITGGSTGLANPAGLTLK